MNTNQMQVEKPNRDLSLLCPWFGQKVKYLVQELDTAGYQVAVMEAYRSPERQNFLYEQGRSRPGPKITNARAWQSWHQWGLAVDLCFYINKKWVWDGPWDKVKSIAEDRGFETLKFESAHFQMTGGMTIGEASALKTKYDMEHVWSVIQQRTGF